MMGEGTGRAISRLKLSVAQRVRPEGLLPDLSIKVRIARTV
jgi:hypothetical protein